MGVRIDEKLPEKHDVNDERAFSYMGLSPGQSTYDIPVQHVFIGSCTNSRLSDLEIAAAVVKGRKVKEGVRALVVPGSKRVRDAAMQKDYITYLKKQDLNGENLDVPCVLE